MGTRITRLLRNSQGCCMIKMGMHDVSPYAGARCIAVYCTCVPWPLLIITPRACARGKAIGFVCRRLSARKSPDLEM